MGRKAFFGFHYSPDNWRVFKVRNVGRIEGNPPVSDNKFEEIKNDGDAAVKIWINDNMNEKSYCIVQVGEKTGGREWIKYKIRKAWNEKMGVLGFCKHKINDKDNNQTEKGRNPFEDFSIKEDGKTIDFDKVVKLSGPPYKILRSFYNQINDNIVGWVKEVIEIRKKY